tara:strand:+ start:1128 stop:1901 length:774 start_codon:yes stop_codon:yes gene_type:complete
MAHISFSELKNWNKCPWYHKNVYINKLAGFQGNEYTAFGTALHNVCEKKILNENEDPDVVFLASFIEEIKSLKEKDLDINLDLIKKMRLQGTDIIPEIDPAVREYFEEFKVIGTEEQIFEPIDFFEPGKYNFKGFIDLVLQTKDGKYHIVDWKTCSWGWNRERRQDRMTTYQLTLYKHFYAQKYNIDPKNIETHFALLKRTAKKNRVEIFRVTSGPQKTENALKLLKSALFNIDKKNYIKNRLACSGCEFYQTEDCK